MKVSNTVWQIFSVNEGSTPKSAKNILRKEEEEVSPITTRKIKKTGISSPKTLLLSLFNLFPDLLNQFLDLFGPSAPNHPIDY